MKRKKKYTGWLESQSLRRLIVVAILVQPPLLLYIIYGGAAKIDIPIMGIASGSEIPCRPSKLEAQGPHCTVKRIFFKLDWV